MGLKLLRLFTPFFLVMGGARLMEVSGCIECHVGHFG